VTVCRKWMWQRAESECDSAQKVNVTACRKCLWQRAESECDSVQKVNVTACRKWRAHLVWL